MRSAVAYKEGDVVLLLPVLPNEGVKFLQEGKPNISPLEPVW
jgi:hypothetical protein